MVFPLRHFGRTLGYDSYYHIYVTKMLLDQGKVPSFNPYHYYGAPHDYPPLFHLLLTPFVKASESFSIPVFTSANILTALLGGLTALVLYKIGKRYGGETCGLLSGFFFGLASVDLHYSGFIRPDNLVCLLMSTSFLGAVLSLAKPEKKFLSLIVFGLALQIFAHNSWLITFTILVVFAALNTALLQNNKKSFNILIAALAAVLIGFLFYKLFAPFMLSKNIGVEYLRSALGAVTSGLEPRSQAFTPLTLYELVTGMNIAIPIFAIFGFVLCVNHIKKEENLFLLVVLSVFSYLAVFKGGRFIVYLELPLVVTASIGFLELKKTFDQVSLASGKALRAVLQGLLLGLLLSIPIGGASAVLAQNPSIGVADETLVSEIANTNKNQKVFSVWDLGHLLAYYKLKPYNDGYPSIRNVSTYDNTMKEILWGRKNNRLELLASTNAKLVYLQTKNQRGLHLIPLLDQTTSYNRVAELVKLGEEEQIKTIVYIATNN